MKRLFLFFTAVSFVCLFSGADWTITAPTTGTNITNSVNAFQVEGTTGGDMGLWSIGVRSFYKPSGSDEVENGIGSNSASMGSYVATCNCNRFQNMGQPNWGTSDDGTVQVYLAGTPRVVKVSASIKFNW